MAAAWFLVPARGGSKGIPRKNVKPLAGKPLIHHVLDTIRQVAPKERVILSSDDEEIAQTGAALATVRKRAADLANDTATLDEVAVQAAKELLAEGASRDDYLVTVQPTSPFLAAATLRAVLAALDAGAGSVLTVKDDRHLRWTRTADGRPKPMFEARVNRQWMAPTLAETGGAIAARLGAIVDRGTRIVEPVALVEVGLREGLDIDTHADWATAEFFAGRLRILIRADGGARLGLGHIYRAVALAHSLAGHDITIVAKDRSSVGATVLARHPFPHEVVATEDEFLALARAQKADLVVLDRLDSTREEVLALKETGAFVVTFEDHGTGADVADVVVNDIYIEPHHVTERHLHGLSNAILAPWFENAAPGAEPDGPVAKVLVTYGGTDPSRLTTKTLEALRAMDFEGEVTVVVGPGYGGGMPDLATWRLKGHVHHSVANMALLMREADLAFTSAGRTVAELLQMGVPSIVMCQNMKELSHTHATLAHGVLNLGLGEHIPPEVLASHARVVMEDLPMRRAMHHRALAAVAGRSNAAIARKILERRARRVQP